MHAYFDDGYRIDCRLDLLVEHCAQRLPCPWSPRIAPCAVCMGACGTKPQTEMGSNSGMMTHSPSHEEVVKTT